VRNDRAHRAVAQTPAVYNAGAWHRGYNSGVEFLKTVGGRIATGAAALAVVVAGISWWQMEPVTRESVIGNVVRGGSWVLVVLLLPWAMFWMIGAVARRDSNVAGAALVGAMTLGEAVWLGGMFGFGGYTAPGWTMFAAAVLAAGVYNLLACDWIAERVA
jgi:hypothetical protein